MRIAVTADLHFGITDEAKIKSLIRDIAEESVDTLVVAGDLGEPYGKFVRCLDLLRKLKLPIAICSGNHDVWALLDFYTSDQLFNDLLPRAVKERGFTWLDTNNLRLGNGVVIAGSMLWYDYSDRSPVTENWSDDKLFEAKKDLNNDARFINWERTDPEFASSCLEGLTDRLDQLENDPAVQSIVLVTHVPIFFEQMVYFGTDNPIMRSYFANFTAGDSIKKYPKVKYVVSGHTHREVKPRSITFDDDRSMVVSTVGSDYYNPKYFVVEVRKIGQAQKVAEM